MVNELPTIELQFNKRFYLLMGIVVLTAGIAYGLFPIVPSLLLRWGIGVVFSGVGMFILVGILIGKPYVKMMALGLETKMVGRSRLIKWLDIAEVKEYTNQNNKMIGVNYLPGRALKSSPTNRRLSGFDDTIANTSTLKFEKFRDLVMQYWQQAKDFQAREVSENLRPQAESGNPQAQFELAEQLVKLGQQDQVLEFYRQAAEVGHVGAQFKYALMLNGKDRLTWIRRASNGTGEYATQAQRTLAHLLFFNTLEKSSEKGILKSPLSTEATETVERFRALAKEGSTDDQLDFGVILRTSFDATFKPEAKHWLQSAARQGDERAVYQLRMLERPTWLGWLPDFTGTALLLLIIVVVMIREVALGGISPSIKLLESMGGTYFDAIQRGEFWRFLTSPLLHGNLNHIVYNAFALLIFGLILEGRAGLTALLFAFVVTGVTGALTSSLLGSHHIISVGASGAIFGILGFSAVYGLYQAREWWDRLKISLLYVFMNLFGTFFIANVDQFAHFGGLLGGFALGFLWRNPPALARRILLFISLGLLTLGTWLTLTRASNTTLSIQPNRPIRYCTLIPGQFGTSGIYEPIDKTYTTLEDAKKTASDLNGIIGTRLLIVPCPTQ
jgi:membrane associated rhomboid family serine protease